MASDKGKGRAAVIPDASLNDKLSSNPRLDRTIQTRIGDQLRAMYDELMQQPVPDRFADLLAKLEQSDEEKAQ
ncbi:MAG TPA: NepR family anti-sigma factor [Microvirga sp.]|nr:NepR family anti-sigma factor [Microvirga sp.]